MEYEPENELSLIPANILKSCEKCKVVKFCRKMSQKGTLQKPSVNL